MVFCLACIILCPSLSVCLSLSLAPSLPLSLSRSLSFSLPLSPSLPPSLSLPLSFSLSLGLSPFLPSLSLSLSLLILLFQMKLLKYFLPFPSYLYWSLCLDRGLFNRFFLFFLTVCQWHIYWNFLCCSHCFFLSLLSTVLSFVLTALWDHHSGLSCLNFCFC